MRWEFACVSFRNFAAVHSYIETSLRIALGCGKWVRPPEAQMRYYHQSHRRCGKPFDPNELPTPKAPLKSEYFAGDPCPKCGQPFEQPYPPSSMLVWVHC